MRKVFLTLALLGVATGAWADENNLGYGVFFAHAQDALVYSTDPPAGGWCGQYIPITDRLQVDSSLPYIGDGTIWYVLAAWELNAGESKLWAGTEFGLGAYNVAAYGFAEAAVCAPAGFLEIPTAGWPGPNEGTAFVTTGTPWSGNFVPVYWFGGYSYYLTGLSTEIPISVDPPTGFCGMSNTQNPPISYTVGEPERGRMGVNAAGFVPAWPGMPEPAACCMPEPLGECRMLLEEDCLLAGGEWQGVGSVCEPNPCEQPGACCIGGICEVMMRENCDILQGAFQGEGTTCDPNPCDAVCCFENPTSPHGCEIMLEAACAAAGGFWHPEWVTCNPNPCEIYTPADETSWGQIKNMYR